MLAFTLPAVTIGLLAAVIVDRTDRRRVLGLTNAARAAPSHLFILFGGSFPLVIVLSVRNSTVCQLFMPADAATIPRLVPAGHLLAANSLFSLTFNTSFIVGMAGAGPLIKLPGTHSVYLVAAAFFVIATILLASLPREDAQPSATLPASLGSRAQLVMGELADGWSFLRTEHQTCSIVLQLAFPWSLAGIIATILPGYASTVLGHSEEDANVLVVPAGLGVILVSLLVGRFGIFVHRPHLISFGLLGVVAVLVLLGTCRTILEWFVAHVPPRLAIDYHPGGLEGFLLIVMVLAAGLGLANATIVDPANTAIKEQTPAGLRGRVFAVLNAISSAGSTAPVLPVGIMADLLGVGRLMLVTGAIIVLAVLLSARAAWRHRRDPSAT